MSELVTFVTFPDRLRSDITEDNVTDAPIVILCAVCLLLHENAKYKQGDNEKLLEYIKPFIDTTATQRRKYFENPVLDAVASHYIDLAKAQDTMLLWNIQLPAELPFRESDICGMICNLLENSLKAVSELPKGQRTVHIGMHFPEENLFALMIRNPLFCYC